MLAFRLVHSTLPMVIATSGVAQQSTRAVVDGYIKVLQSYGILSPLNVIVFLYFLFGSFVYKMFEGWSTLDSCYFLMVTSTTVGYGDIVPTTRVSKLFTIFYAFIGMTIIITAISPVVDFLMSLIESAEHWIVHQLTVYKFIPPAVDTLDMSLSMEEVNAHISYSRRYLLALIAPGLVMAIGVALGMTLVGDFDWVDAVYWMFASMTTIGYGDVAPTSKSGKLVAMAYLPLAVAALGQALSSVGMIATRKRIREEDHGKVADLLLLEASNGDPDESITEGEFLIMILQREGLVDADTVTAIRRQFRHLVRHGDQRVPFEMRCFDAMGVFRELKERNRIIQRPSHFKPGSRKGRKEMVDLEAKDGGYNEWLVQHWSRRISEKKQEMESTGRAVPKSASGSPKRRQIYMRGGVAMFTPLVGGGGGAPVGGTSIMSA